MSGKVCACAEYYGFMPAPREMRRLCRAGLGVAEMIELENGALY